MPHRRFHQNYDPRAVSPALMPIAAGPLQRRKQQLTIVVEFHHARKKVRSAKRSSSARMLSLQGQGTKTGALAHLGWPKSATLAGAQF
jgi:hypothetical protein